MNTLTRLTKIEVPGKWRFAGVFFGATAGSVADDVFGITRAHLGIQMAVGAVVAMVVGAGIMAIGVRLKRSRS